MFDISICITTYNRSSLLRQCLESLANFEDTSFELIIGDNASEDETQVIIAELKNKFPYFINVQHKTNIGFARNMDSILRHASRKYVYILNDDDIVFENALKLSETLMNVNE
jgi:glycosyltransferase involved in cell wall biosynthesis